MNNDIFEDALQYWKNSDGHTSFWNDLAKKWGYNSGEHIRSAFKNERKRRGITKDKIELEVRKNTASVLVFDVETAPMQVYTFGMWDQNIGVEQVISHIFLLSWSAKLLNSSFLYNDVLTPKEAKKKDDSRIVKEIWNMLNDKDILIGQNIKEFDLKVLNTRFLYYGMKPLSHHKIVDTLIVARSNFAFPSNSLKFINKFLGIKQKKENAGFRLWKECMEGNADALKEMSSYCDGDVLAEEDLYYKMRPFIKGHPNLALYSEIQEDICPNCGSFALVEEGYYYTPSSKFESVRCEDCGAVSRRKQNQLSKSKRKSLLA